MAGGGHVDSCCDLLYVHGGGLYLGVYSPVHAHRVPHRDPVMGIRVE